jgi:hypothetical protein
MSRRYEMAMGLVHPAPDYPAIAPDSADAFFASVDHAGLVEAAGIVFAEVTCGLLAFDAGKRLSLDQAQQRLHVAYLPVLPVVAVPRVVRLS